MTREEAIEFITQSVKSDVDMALIADAIKALEQDSTTKNNLGVDAVSREAVLDMCKKEIDHISKNWQDYHSPSEAKSGFVYIATNIYDLHPVTPQQKTGRWIAYEVRLPDRTILNYRCSICGRKLIGYNTETLSEAPFCHCGAKMLEPQESEET